MNTVPKTDAPLLGFAETHAATWFAMEGGPEQIGLTKEQVEKYAGLYEEAKAAYAAAQAARNAAMAATAAMRDKMEALRRRSADLVGVVKAYAHAHARDVDSTSTAPQTLAKAQLPLPAAPEGVRPPGTPGSLNPALQSDGSITLSWTASNAAASSGGQFIVMRKVNGRDADYTLLDRVPGTSARARRVTYTDRRVPIGGGGALGVSYYVVPVRRHVYGPASPAVTVVMGGGGGGMGGGMGGGGGGVEDVATGSNQMAVRRAA